MRGQAISMKNIGQLLERNSMLCENEKEKFIKEEKGEENAESENENENENENEDQEDGEKEKEKEMTKSAMRVLNSAQRIRNV